MLLNEHWGSVMPAMCQGIKNRQQSTCRAQQIPIGQVPGHEDAMQIDLVPDLPLSHGYQTIVTAK